MEDSKEKEVGELTLITGIDILIVMFDATFDLEIIA